MKKIILCILILCLSVLTACSGSITGYSGDREKVGSQEYVISDNGKKAFAGTYSWDGDLNSTRIVIADEVNGAKVEGLGGFTGTGVPNRFEIIYDPVFPDNFAGASDPEYYGNAVVYEEITFTVVLGKNVNDVYDFGNAGPIGRRQDDGTITFYYPVIRFAVDPENKTYYADEGKLYLRKDSTLEESVRNVYTAELPSYEDRTLAEKLTGTWRSGDDIYEIFCEFGKVFMNVGNYYEGSLYAFYGLYGQPEDPDVLNDRKATQLSGMFTWFSDFSPGTVEANRYDLSLTGTVLTMTSEEGEVTTLMGDSSVMKQFPADPREITGLLQGTDATSHLWPLHTLVDGTLKNDDISIKVYADGIIDLYRRNSETIQVYRGVLIPVQDKEYVYSLCKLGGGTMPYFGRFKAEKDGDRVILTKITDSDAIFLEGEEEIILTRVK